MTRNRQQKSGAPSGTKAPIAILGYHMDLPCKRDISGDDLEEIIKQRDFVGFDFCEHGIIQPWQYDGEGNPWLFQHRKGHLYARGDQQCGDFVLMQITEKESKFLSPMQLMALESVWKGLENSGLTTSCLHKTRTGVFVAGYQAFGGFESYPDETALRGGLMSGLSDRIAYFLGTHGPSVTVETACSSSLVALTLAVDSIRNGSCDVAVLVAINALSIEYELALQATGVISGKGECRPFDDDASGTLRCEGCGCLVLCSVGWAEKNDYSDTIKAMVVNSIIASAGADPKAKHGSGRVYESPNAHGMAQMIQMCHQQVGVPLEHVRYVEAHATGTAIGDLIELQALKEVYQDSHDADKNPLRVGSIKGNIGHAEIAAGLFSMIKVLEMIRKNTFFPTGGRSISPRKDFDWEQSNIKLCLEMEAFPQDETIYLGVNSFGVGGSYAHAIICAYDRSENETKTCLTNASVSAEIRPLLFTISAASERHLDEYEKRLVCYLHGNPDKLTLLDICGCFATNRSSLPFSRHYLVRSIDDLVDKLSSEPKIKVCESAEHSLVIAMIFTGQGSQWLGMGERLMVFKAYRDAVEQFDIAYRKYSGWSPLMMLTSLSSERLSETRYAQPLSFMVQLGLVELLKYFGVTPSVVLGHSAGEIAALYSCGALSLEDSAKVIYYRSHYQQTLAGNGRMLAAQMSHGEAKEMLKLFSSETYHCEIACMNSPTSVVIAGPQDELQILRDYMSTKQVKNTFLQGDVAFHSSFMNPILDEVERKMLFLGEKKLEAGNVPILSSVTANPLLKISPEYLVHNIRQPVRFFKAVEYMLDQYDPDIILEIGPHKTLAPLVMECMGSSHNAKVLTSLSKGQDDIESFLQLMLGLIQNKTHINLELLYKDLGYRFSKVADKRIPGHPFLMQNWSQLIIPRKKAAMAKWDVGPAAGTLESQSDKRVSIVEISKATCPSMMDHVMGGQPLLPGMYFVESAIEVWGLQHHNCLTMTDVDFLAMCPVPDRSKNQLPRKLFVKLSTEETNGLIHFTVESKPLGGSDTTVHCKGAIASFSCPNRLDGTQYLPGRMGFRAKSDATRDIGPEGIKSLLESHSGVLTKAKFYDMINEHGVTDYESSFQVVEEVRVNLSRSSLVATLQYDHMEWSKKGGVYGIQLLDGILQLGFLNPNMPSGHVMYAGGFEFGIFARKPVNGPCIAHLKFPGDKGRIHGKSLITGDAIMYDLNGDLLCHLVGIKCIIGKRITRTFDSIQSWQPLSISDAEKADTVQCLEGTQGGMKQQDLLARITFDLMKSKRNSTIHGASYLRILEYWEDSCSSPTLFESLALTESKFTCLDFDYLVEIFVATHNENVLQKGLHVPSKHKNWLRVRLVLLPSAQDVLNTLCFDIIAAWNIDAGEENEDWEQGPSVFVKNASKLGYQGTLLVHNFEYEPNWNHRVENVREHDTGFSTCRLQQEALLLHDQTVTKNLLLVSDDTDVSGALLDSIKALIYGWDSKVIVEASCMDSGDEPGMLNVIEKFIKCQEDYENHLIILDGILDTSKYAQKTFVLASKIANYLSEKKGNNSHIWIVTCNAFGGPVNVDHGSLLPLVSGINNTFRSVSAKFVDLYCPITQFHHLGRLILSNPGPNEFMIDGNGTVHQSVVLPAEIGCPPKRVDISAADPNVLYKYDWIPMDQSGKGGYDFFAHRVKSPSKGEVLVDIHAASLNFRDIMLTLNALPKSSFESSFYGYSIGMEASGIVSEVGEGVNHISVGDHVVVSEPGNIASKLIARADRVVSLKGSNISLEQAACLPSVYCTAYYALLELCNLQKGERVLVHAAAGGVGHAAISLCSYIGAEVYATASQSKQDYCSKEFGIPPNRLFDSRSTKWFERLMEATNDEGVDIVLNCLSGEHQRLGIECLRPGGRFCEIGKVDIFNNEKLYLFAFRKNIRFYAIDMDRMNLEDSDLVQEVRAKVFEHVVRGDFKCLPFTTFTMDKIKDAIDYMKSGSHIGKVLLTNFPGDEPIKISTRRLVFFDPESYVLIFGGAGGFGSRLIRWAFEKGARNFITTVRKDPSRVTEMFADLILSGARFEVIEADLAFTKDLEKIEQFVTGAPIHGQIQTIIHCAGIYEAFYFEKVPENVLEREGDIKVRSALFLDRLSRKLGGIKDFIIVGSNSSDIAAPFFASYAASNAMLASIARQREASQLPVTILHMSSLKDVGIVSKDDATLAYQKKSGIELINSARAIQAFEKMLSDQINQMLQSFYFHHSVTKQLGTGWTGARTTSIVDSLLIFGEQSKGSKTGAAHISYNSTLERVIWLLVETIGLDKNQITATTSLSSIGIDSLGILDFRQQLQDEFDFSLDRSAFAMTVGELTKEIYNKLKDTIVKVDEVNQEDIQEETVQVVKDQALAAENGTSLSTYYTIENPKGYLIVFPGADQKGLYFVDWKLDDIQIIIVDLISNRIDPKATSQAIALALQNNGYLIDKGAKMAVLGYSIGCFSALELCKELINTYSFVPSGFIPICYTAPEACRNFLHLLPKTFRRIVMKRMFNKQLLREYGIPDPSDEILYSVYQQRPDLSTILAWEEDAQVYFRQVSRDVKHSKGPYMGANIPIHYIHAKKDQVGNPKKIADPMRHGWSGYTSGPFKASTWYGKHSSLVDPTVGHLFREFVLNIVQDLLID